MSKSTPLSQLPSVSSLTQVPLNVNDAQRQQAVSSFVIPQNTQASADIANEDDNTVAEVLNQLNGGATSNTNVQNEPPPQLAPQLPLQDPSQYMQQAQAQLQQQNTYLPPPLLMQNNGMMPGMFSDLPTNNMFQSSPSPVDQYAGYEPKRGLFDLSNINADIRNVVLISIVYLIVSFVPVHKLLTRYIALDKIPYSTLAIRAVIAGLLCVLAMKL